MKKGSFSVKRGLPPGTLVYTGRHVEDFEIEVIDYDAEKVKELKTGKIEDCLPLIEKGAVTWINVIGLHNTEAIRKVGEHLNLHPLVLEDILNVTQRPKVEFFDDYIFLVLKMLTYNPELRKIESEHISVILGQKFVLTFQEKRGDLFDPVRGRIRSNKGIIRKRGPDYLFYALIDVLVDNYFYMLEKLGDEIEELEGEVIGSPASGTVHKIHELKRNLIELRRSIWPLREILNLLYKEKPDLIKEETIPYLRDVYDHIIQVIEIIESLRETTGGLLDVYLSSVSNKMNEVMKVLTIIATIFMPITFIAGIYGMNFEYMPELKWRWGYPVVLIAMLIISLGMIIYFRRKKWL
ncbi:MAG: magnesium/cobalt transporter CorA [Synergistetes bacterium]|nr:MAG: Magnesium transport protein corA [bacterium 42_11]MBC7331822.1 magnesium/cobalt transporter CorA [Synergistota bacterium]